VRKVIFRWTASLAAVRKIIFRWPTAPVFQPATTSFQPAIA
jgi:hypothetical protein